MSLLRGRIDRPDSLGKARGEALYTEDIVPTGMLHLAIVRSSLASARIVDVDTTRAADADGVAAVLAAEDLPDRRWGTIVHDQPILARDVVRFVGEPLALVVADTAAAARSAAALVAVRLEPLPMVVGLEAALADDAARVHADTPNVGRAARIQRGDVDAAFRAAGHVVRTTITTQRVYQGYIEPRATLVEPGPDGVLLVTTTSQAPFVVRKGLAALLERPMSSIVVTVPTLGGGFGGKLHLGLSPLAAVACLATGRPVRAVAERGEDMQTSNPRENSLVEMESAVGADGRILARRARVYLDAGAYAFDTPSIASIAALQATGPYDIPALDIEARPVYTNTCPTGSFRGPSGPQMVYAHECHLEEIAATVGIDAVEVRRRNLLRSGARGPTGELVPDSGMDDCLEVVVDTLARWRADAPAGGPRRGYGLACAWWLTAGLPSAASVEIHEDGTATLRTGGTEIGTGAVTAGVAAIAADELGLPLSAIRVVANSTGGGPYDAGSKGSRTLYGAGNAVLRAARDAVRMVRDEAAEQLEAAPEDIVVEGGGVAIRGAPATAIPLAKVVQGALNRTGPIVGRGRFSGEQAVLEGSRLEGLLFDAFNEPTFHCHGVELELDELTGRIRVLRYVAVHDVGVVLNPLGARGQVEGGVVQGLGYAISEVMDIDESGRVRNADLVDYRLPTIADVPREIETVFVEGHPGRSGPHGAKGVGEPPVILPAAAVGSAIRDLTGAQPLALPFDPIRICDFLDALKHDQMSVEETADTAGCQPIDSTL